MEIEERKITEILLASILVVVLIILILLVTNPNQFRKTDSKNPATQIINSYNTDSHDTYYSDEEYRRYSKPVLVHSSSEDYENKYLSYRSDGERIRTEGIFGNDIDKYVVHLRNPNPTGGYYKIKFNFEDYYGNPKTESVIHYLEPYEKKEIYYTDINADRLKNYRWDYEITSLTKIPYRDYVEVYNTKYSRDRNI